MLGSFVESRRNNGRLKCSCSFFKQVLLNSSLFPYYIPSWDVEKDTSFVEMIPFFSQTFKSIVQIEKNGRETEFDFPLLPFLSIRFTRMRLHGENSFLGGTFRGKYSFNGRKVAVDEFDRAIVCGRREF